ncbi:tape measure protein [Azonexus fungiphilus]|uniref:tape measure protein n=1 Tax=Azonexus fungiphilus TaxID=146940 RepID=UPI00156AE116|nr:tape measure protein [Azonexus fungiphilus]NHC05936.1 tape measure protein [Azonexus fungiphilus]
MSGQEVTVGLKIEGDGSGGIRAAESTEKAIRSLDVQMNKLGIRSADQINADILEINQTLQQLARRADLTGDEFDRAFSAGQQRLVELKQEAAAGGEALDGVGRRANNLSSLMGKLGVAFGGLELARQFVVVNAELENIERSFQAVTGSVEKAAEEMDYARDVAARLGLAQLSTARTYADLIAGTKGSAVEGEKTRAVFEAVARSMSLAGRSAAETEGALKALEQMASKGVVQMEELRGQLGDRLPGAMNAVAEGLGITTDNLNKLVVAGQMTAEEIFPALTFALNKLYKDASSETLTQEWNHFKTAVENAYTTIGDAGAVNILKGALEAMEAVIFGTSTGIVALGKNIGVLMGALANGDIGVNGFSENAKQAFAEIEEEVRQRTARIAQHNSLVAAGLDEVGQKMLAQATEQRSSTDAAVSDWTKLNVAYLTVKESTAAATAQAEKMADATKQEGAAAIEAAEALGSEADQRRARMQAAVADAAALAAVAERRRDEAAAALEHANRMKEEAAAAGGATEQRQKVIDGLVKLAEARQVEAAAATAQAQQSAMAAVRAKVEASAYESARGELSKWSATKEAQFAVDQAGIRLAIEQQRSIMEVAKARGNDLQAARAQIEIKRLEVKLAELTAVAKKAEAEAMLAAVAARREELVAAGQMTAAKEAELKASEAGAQVKLTEAQIAAETAKRMRDLAQITAAGGAASFGAAGQYDALAESLRGVADAARAAGSEMESSQSFFSGGGRQADRAVDVETMLYQQGASIAEAKAAAKYYAELFEREQATTLTGNLGNGQRAAKLTNLANERALRAAIDLAREELASGQAVDLGDSVADLRKRELARINYGAGVNGQRAQSDAINRAGRQAQGQTFTVKLVHGDGRTKSAGFSSASDAEAATNLLRSLEESARSAS